MQMTKFAVSHLGAIPENLFQTEPDSYSKSRMVLLLLNSFWEGRGCEWMWVSVSHIIKYKTAICDAAKPADIKS